MFDVTTFRRTLGHTLMLVEGLGLQKSETVSQYTVSPKMLWRSVLSYAMIV